MTQIAVNRASRVSAISVVVAMAALSTWLVARAANAPAHEPTHAGLQAAGDAVAAEARHGDAIAMLPAWSANERWRYERTLRAIGSPLDWLTLSDPLQLWDIEGASRLWVVSTHGLGPAYARALPPELTLESEADFGHGTEVRLYLVPPSRIVYDFRRMLQRAEVERTQPKAAPIRCHWENDKHVCGSEWWKNVWQGLNEVGDTRRDCIFVQPWPDGGTLSLTWRDVPFGATLDGRVGLRLWALRYDEGSDVRFVVKVGEAGSGGTEEVMRVILPRADPEWHAFSVPLDGKRSRGDVRFEIGAENTVWRQACFDARMHR